MNFEKKEREEPVTVKEEKPKKPKAKVYDITVNKDMLKCKRANFVVFPKVAFMAGKRLKVPDGKIKMELTSAQKKELSHACNCIHITETRS